MRRLLMNAACRSAVYFCCTCVCLLLSLVVIQPLSCNGDSFGQGAANFMLQPQSSPEILRFHVRADSNNHSDQQVKNEVAARILKHYAPAWRECSTREELNLLLAQEQEAMVETARQALTDQGVDQEVSVLLERSKFPARLYEDNYYPPGEYEALVVVLGSGKGENWWCVIFPPLCFNVVPAPVCTLQKDDYGNEAKKAPSEEKLEHDDEAEDGDESKWRFWVVDYFKPL